MLNKQYYLSALPGLISALGNKHFASQLLSFVRGVAHFDSSVIMAYPDSGSLSVLHNDLHAGDQSGFSGAYRDGLWLLSPTYLHAKSGKRGCFRITDLAPDNFRDSEYYALYHSSSGVEDQCLYLMETGDGTPLALSLERTSALPPFSKQEFEQLESITETLAALVRKHWKSGLESSQPGEMGLHLQLQHALEQFGADVLTPRERDVVQLVLKGFPSKLAAKKLGISSQTEQVHRKNIYQKLGLSSHTELFSMFFSVLVEPDALATPPPTPSTRELHST